MQKMTKFLICTHTAPRVMVSGLNNFYAQIRSNLTAVSPESGEKPPKYGHLHVKNSICSTYDISEKCFQNQDLTDGKCRFS